MKFLISSFNTTKLFLEQEERNMYIQSDVDKCLWIFIVKRLFGIIIIIHTFLYGRKVGE